LRLIPNFDIDGIVHHLAKATSLLILLVAPTIYAAAFDCSKASTSVERLICSDATLSSADDDLAAAYAKGLSNSSHPDTLRQQQRTWLNDVRNPCNEANCLKAAYRDRIQTLVSTPPSAAAVPMRGIPLQDIDNPAIDVSSISIESRWTPGSRAYVGFPGEFTISASFISFGNCEQPFTVVRDNTREDNLWNGIDAARDAKRYRDISIRILPNPKCESVPDQVFRFLIAQGNPCYADLMLYASEKDLQGNHWSAWGNYTSCHIRGIKAKK